MKDEGDRSAAAQPLTVDANNREATPVSSSSAPLQVGSQVRDRFPDLHAQSLAFLAKVKAHFGPGSKVSTNVHNALGEFAAGKVSKRDTYFCIFNEVETDELRHDLNSILDHPDALYSAEDFQREPTIPNPPAAPAQFLQPQYQPQIPMPRWPDFWNTSPGHLSRSVINPELLQDNAPVPPRMDRELPLLQTQGMQAPLHIAQHSTYDPVSANSTQNGVHPTFLAQSASSSPAVHHSPHHFQGYVQHTSPVTGHAQPYIDYGHASDPTSPGRGTGGYPHRFPPIDEAWGSYNNTGRNYSYDGNAPYNPAMDEMSSIGTNGLTHLADHKPAPHVMSPGNSYYVSSYLSQVPTVVQAREPHPMMLPASQPINNEINTDCRPAGEGFIPEERAIPRQKPNDPRAQFVHAICGKTFTTRRAVRKHHWGARMEDLETITGCWAKHGKPNIEWDADPSCIEDATKRAPTRQSQVDLKAPTVPSMVRQHLSITPAVAIDVPTSEGLPHRVADTLHYTPISPHFPRTVPHDTSMYSNQGSYGGFETLLTAANVASSIEGPFPQGRHDSVVNHLEATAAASEFRGRHTPFWMDVHVSRGYFGQYQGHGYTLPQATGLGISENEYATGTPATPAAQNQEVVDDIVRANSMTMGLRSGIVGNQATNNDKTGGHQLAKDASTGQGMEAEAKRSGHKRSISKKELKGLGLSTSPEREKKRQKTAPVPTEGDAEDTKPH